MPEISPLYYDVGVQSGFLYVFCFGALALLGIVVLGSGNPRAERWFKDNGHWLIPLLTIAVTIACVLVALFILYLVTSPMGPFPLPVLTNASLDPTNDYIIGFRSPHSLIILGISAFIMLVVIGMLGKGERE